MAIARCGYENCNEKALGNSTYCETHDGLDSIEREPEEPESQSSPDDEESRGEAGDETPDKSDPETPAPEDKREPAEENRSSLAATAEAAKVKALQIKQKAMATVERVKWTVKAIVGVVTNPATYLILLVAFLLMFAITIDQTYGRSDAKSGAQMSQEVIERLTQRAVFITMYDQDFPSTGASPGDAGTSSKRFTLEMGGDLGSWVAGNNWITACNDIVGMIYGQPKDYVAWDGRINAIRNYEHMKSMGHQPIAWWFDNGDSSPGASQNSPPPGAIVSSAPFGDPNAQGHTWVMLTDEIIIDNTVSVGDEAKKPEYRVGLSYPGSEIVGWVLPPAEGYEGEFLNDRPDLPPVPEWAWKG